MVNQILMNPDNDVVDFEVEEVNYNNRDTKADTYKERKYNRYGSIVSKKSTYLSLLWIIIPMVCVIGIFYVAFHNDQNIYNIDYSENVNSGIVAAKEEKVIDESENVEEVITVILRRQPEDIYIERNIITLEAGQTDRIGAKIIPENAHNTTISYFSMDENIVKVDEFGGIVAINPGKTTIRMQSEYKPEISRGIEIEVKEKPKEESKQEVRQEIIEEPAREPVTNTVQEDEQKIQYINGVIIVNKKYSLPKDYNPGVNQTALNAFESMKRDAQNEGISLTIVSGFRSYNTQAEIYNKNVRLYGEQEANRFSAKPGESEHQTGLAFDINSTQSSFGATKEGIWLGANCHRYGFIIRYPEGKEHITGYIYEPWHIRYVGAEIATDIYNRGVTLEEYFGI